MTHSLIAVFSDMTAFASISVSALVTVLRVGTGDDSATLAMCAKGDGDWVDAEDSSMEAWRARRRDTLRSKGTVSVRRISGCAGKEEWM